MPARSINIVQIPIIRLCESVYPADDIVAVFGQQDILVVGRKCLQLRIEVRAIAICARAHPIGNAANGGAKIRLGNALVIRRFCPGAKSNNAPGIGNTNRR